MRIDVLRGHGDPAHRLGEEAEHRGLLRELAARGIETLPRDPAEASPAGPEEPPRGESGADIPAPGPGTAPPPAAPEALLLSGRAGEPADESLIASWFEAARCAARAGRPVVVTGLVLDGTEGPAETLGELLSTAALVGLRDETSLDRARRLRPRHPALRVGGDDALVLPPPTAASDRSRGEGPAPEDPPPGTDSPRVVAAVGRPAGPFSPEEAAPVLAALLDALVHRTGGAVALLPCSGTAADVDFAADVAALLPDDVSVQGAAPEPAADALVGAADYVVTTCRNAVALGVAGGAHVLPLAADEYSMHSMQVVLARWGLVEHAVPLAALLTPGGAAWDTRAAVQQWAAEAVEHRGTVRAAVADAVPGLRAASALWWDAVAEALRGGRPRHPPEAGVAPRGVGAPVVRALRRRYTVPAAPAARPTVVVVLRTGGRPALPTRALDDVLAQTFTDWRLVVVDDGGDPGTVDELLARHRGRLAGRATVLHHRRALGPGAAANRGLRAADSEFVVLHDADDPWHPTVLQRAVAHLEDPLVADDGVLVRAGSLPAATDAATDPATDATTGAASEQDGAGEPRGGTVRPAPPALTLLDALDGAPAVPGTLVYRRAVHGVLGDYDETLAASPDWEFALRFLETFTAGLLPGRPLPGRERPEEESGARRRDELLVRERHLRQWTSENGIGLPLYVSRAVGQRTDRLAERLDASQALTRELLDVVRAQSAQLERLERTVAEKGFAAFWRRVWRALRGR